VRKLRASKRSLALAGGNTIAIKPSEQTPLTTLKLARIIPDILPAGVVNVVIGRGDTVGSALINHPKVAMISLTGDIATGKKVFLAAAKSVKRTHLELGGKAPIIVFDDADLAAVVEGVQGFRLLQRRPGWHSRLPRLCQQGDIREARCGFSVGGEGSQIQPGHR
jgi:aminobutyraldehyde dehydrogenase